MAKKAVSEGNKVLSKIKASVGEAQFNKFIETGDMPAVALSKADMKVLMGGGTTVVRDGGENGTGEIIRVRSWFLERNKDVWTN